MDVLLSSKYGELMKGADPKTMSAVFILDGKMVFTYL
jgi:hypothetical protein